MRVEPIGSFSYTAPYRPKLGFISPSNPDPSAASALISSISPVKNKQSNGMSKVFSMIMDIYNTAIASFTTVEEKIPSYDYNSMYLEMPNARIRELATSITDRSDPNDEKALKIVKWVHDNFPYVTDEENYGVGELWAPPILSLTKGSGDCEDGAFLVHSLMLNAGVPWERLRTYGGIVKAGTGAQTGGHGWTAYKREKDNQWIVLDTSYYINDLPVAKRPLMKEDTRYIDDYFYMNEFYLVLTDKVNRVRDPDGAVAGYNGYNMFGYGLYGSSKVNAHVSVTV